MTIETKSRRTYDEVTVDLLIERLSDAQLLELVGSKHYQEFQPKILESLLPKNNLGVSGFRKVHSSIICDIKEIKTGKDVRVGGFDMDFGRWSSTLPLKQLACTHHKTASVTYIDNREHIIEGSFIEYLE